MMLAIKEAASDMSPYVRKTAAHAIPKLYRYARIAPQGTGS
jgi:AP-3 complex subunit beta